MSDEQYRLMVVVLLGLIAGTLLGAGLSIGMDVHDLRNAATP